MATYLGAWSRRLALIVLAVVLLASPSPVLGNDQGPAPANPQAAAGEAVCPPKPAEVPPPGPEPADPGKEPPKPGPKPPDPGTEPPKPGPQPPDPGPRPNDSDTEKCDPATGRPYGATDRSAMAAWQKKNTDREKWQKTKDKHDEWQTKKDALAAWEAANKAHDDWQKAKDAHDAWVKANEAYQAYLKALAGWQAEVDKKKGNEKNQIVIPGASDSRVNGDDRQRIGSDEKIVHNSYVTNPSGVIGAGSDATFLERVIDYEGWIDWYPGDTSLWTFAQQGPDVFGSPPGIFSTLTRTRGSQGEVTGYTMVDRYGQQTNFSAGGQVQARIDRDGNQESYLYQGNRVVAKVAPNGLTVFTFMYYPSGRLAGITDVAGNIRTFSYDVNAALTDYTDPATPDYPQGRRWVFSFSSGDPNPALNGNLLSITDPDGVPVVAFTYDAADRVATETRGGGTWQYSYALVGGARTTTITDPRGALTTMTWDPGSKYPNRIEQFTNLDVRSTDPDSYVWRFAYDANYCLVTQVAPGGSRVDRQYDAGGNVVEVRQKETDTPLNGATDKVWAYTYGAQGQMTQATDPSGAVTAYTWLNGKLVRIDYPQTIHHGTVQNGYELFAYNAVGQKTSWTTRDGIEYRWIYYATGPARGRVQSMERGPVGASEASTWTYDAFGNVTSFTDGDGHQVTAAYDSCNQLTEFTRAAIGSPRVRFHYSGRGRVVQRDSEYLDDQGVPHPQNPWISQYTTYGASDRIVQIQDETCSGGGCACGNTTWLYEYDLCGNLTRKIGPSRTEKYTYDELGRLHTVMQAEGTSVAGTETIDYSLNGRPSRHVHENGQATHYFYDGFDRLVTHRDALGQEVRYEYGAKDMAVRRSVWSPASVLVAEDRYEYDQIGRLTAQSRTLLGTPPRQLRTLLHWTVGNRLSKTVDALGVIDEFAYDVRGRLSRYSMANDKERCDFTYDARGMCTEVLHTLRNAVTQSSETYQSTHAYDAAGNAVDDRVWDRLNSTQFTSSQRAYDSFGRLTRYTSAVGDTVRVVYDEGGPMTGVVREIRGAQGQVVGSRTVTFGYVCCGLVGSVTDDNGRVTHYEYDARGRVKKVIYPDLTSHTLAYAFGTKLSSEVDPNGTTVTYTHDVLGRLTNVAVQRAQGVGGTTGESFVFNSLGRVVTATNDFVTIDRIYDSLSRETSETTAPSASGTGPLTVSAAYDDEDNLVSMTYPGGAVVQHTYGASDELASTLRNSVTLAEYQYLGVSRLLARQFVQDGTSLSTSHDGFLRQTLIDHRSGQTPFAQFGYGYLASGALSYVQRNHLGGTGDTYTYDRDLAITSVLRGVANPPAEVANPGSQVYVTRLDYALDGVVNRATTTVTPFGGAAAVAAYATNSRNLYTAVGGTNRTYDANGNLKDDGTLAYTYDYRNQLVEVVAKATQTVVWQGQYDTAGRLYQVTTAGATERYVPWQSTVVEERGVGGVLREYVYAPHALWKPIAMVVGGGARYMFHEDLGGSVSHVTDAAGAVVEEYRYDEFGGHTVHNGAGVPIAASAIGNPLRFGARRYFQAIGLYDFGARAYESTTGRFLQQDPLGAWDNVNLVSAMNHNPLSFSDLDGRKIEYGGTNPFNARARKVVERLRNSGATGKALVEKLEKSSHTVTLYSNNSNGTLEVGKDNARIRFNLDDCDGGKDEDGNTARPPYVALGHEMQHAADIFDGASREEPSGRNLGSSESSAVRTENHIRFEAGLKQRVEYLYGGGRFDTRHLMTKP